MPALKIYGRRWHTTTDMVPVPCILGSVFHGAWVVIFIVLVRHYHIWVSCLGEGKHYVVTTAGLMAVFVLCFLGELVLAILGVQGLCTSFICALHNVHLTQKYLILCASTRRIPSSDYSIVLRLLCITSYQKCARSS